MFDRIAVRRTMRAQLRDFETNSFDHEILWRFVNATLDAVEENETANTPRPETDYVLMQDGRPVAVRSTRGRARGEKARRVLSTGTPPRRFTIHALPREEQD